jgi:hypothetical protein
MRPPRPPPLPASRTAEKGIRSAKHFHTLHELRRHVLARHQTVQAVIGHIVGIQHKAAHKVGLLEVAEAARRAHARIVEQHIAHALGLLILNQIAGIAGGGKRGLHHVLVSQHADTRAARHLPTRKGLARPWAEASALASTVTVCRAASDSVLEVWAKTLCWLHSARAAREIGRSRNIIKLLRMIFRIVNFIINLLADAKHPEISTGSKAGCKS